MPDPAGPGLAAVGTGHLTEIAPPAPGVTARLREAGPLVELRVPFSVGRAAVDDVERGSHHSDWQPVKDAARAMAFAEDRAIFDGYPAAGAGAQRRLRPVHPGGDFALHLGQDLAIGYASHDASTIELYVQETLTFLTYTDEAVVVLKH
ncbi:encapsulin [Streptomyces sp. A1-5]|nr:encapsulin [Streptomyces sp. A1-5]